MILMRTSLAALTLSMSITAFAAPTYLTTHNTTNQQSNAYIAGVPSPFPTAGGETNQLYWNMVRLACYGHTVGEECNAMIKMATDTETPVEIGQLSLNIQTGDINPKELSANGYTIKVNGPGEVTLLKD